MSNSRDLLPLLTATTFGPAMIVAAVQGSDTLPQWRRASTGVVAMGMGLHALMTEPSAPVNEFVAKLAKATEHEMEHTKDPAIAMQIALDHLKKNPDYYVKLEQAGL